MKRRTECRATVMNYFVILSVVVPFVGFIGCAGTSLLLALRKDAQLCARSPDTLSYKWGYFLGYSGIITAALAIAAGTALIAAGFYRSWVPIVMAYALGLGIASYGVLMRRKWGWLLHIPLSLNMGLWAFNSVYVNNRWREFPWR
jgi:hypothetical protein